MDPATPPAPARLRALSGKNRTTQAKFECRGCGHTANADQVGALDLAIRAGLVLPDVA
ncbi:hypothetical protein [Streptomyces sp. NPDC058572]|uniref:hypothetical protein n=1 Tax=Streptomyces sp. NPDC058572 TaxID=3346546 RepID=UPI0036668AFC